MTTPDERTRAVIETRHLLQSLATGEVVSIPSFQNAAINLLRHYPLDIDMSVSASALPGLWAQPIRKAP